MDNLQLYPAPVKVLTNTTPTPQVNGGISPGIRAISFYCLDKPHPAAGLEGDRQDW